MDMDKIELFKAMKEMMAKMGARMDANHEKMVADQDTFMAESRAWQEKIQAEMEAIRARTSQF
jgi:FtsZ-binding cell division protein ZapB